MVLTKELKAEIFEPYIAAIKDARLRRGLSQARLAEAVGLSSKYVTLVESYRRLPALECLLAVMAEAGVQRSLVEDLVEDILNQFTWQG